MNKCIYTVPNTHLLISDVKSGFEYWANSSHPIIGDTVELIFKASLWKYSNLTVMNRTHWKVNLTNIGPGWAENRTVITHYM
jgi:hypothetical protein